jgi:REP element-mobilizing transposase RayT
MPFDRHKHHRRSIRLPGYDYSSAGAYFVTLCTYGRDCLFGAVDGGTVRLNDYGLVARDEWLRTGEVRAEIELDAFVVMPNHIHGIVLITDDVGAKTVGAPAAGATGVGATGRSPLRPRGPAKRSLASFICGYKPAVTRRINLLRNTPGARVWQRNYYERIIRDDDEAWRARAYINENPARWAEDDYYVGA